MIARAERRILEAAEVEVDLGRRSLDLRQRVDERERHPILADLEILQGALGLRTPEPLGGDVDFAHRVGFDAHLLCHGASALAGRVEIGENAAIVAIGPSLSRYRLPGRDASANPGGWTGARCDTDRREFDSRTMIDRVR